MERMLNEILDRLKSVEADVKTIKKRDDCDREPASEFRDFIINTAANIVGNAISTPTLINLNPQRK